MPARIVARHCARPVVDVAASRKVAGEHTPVGEVFHRKGELGRDDERLEQALLDRIAEEEVAILGLNRQVDAQRRDQRASLGAGGDDHHVRVELVERTDVLVAHVETFGERLDDRLRPVEVAVLSTPGSTGERVRAQPRHELGCLSGGHDA